MAVNANWPYTNVTNNYTMIRGSELGRFFGGDATSQEVSVTLIPITTTPNLPGNNTLFMKVAGTHDFIVATTPTTLETINGVDNSIILRNVGDFIILQNRQANSGNLGDPDWKSQAGNIGSLLRSNQTVHITNFTASTNSINCVDSSVGFPITATLPTQGDDNLMDGKIVIITDTGGQAATKNIVILNESTEFNRIKVNYGSAMLIYIETSTFTGWKILSQTIDVSALIVAAQQWRGTWSGTSAGGTPFLYPNERTPLASDTILAGDYWDVPATYTNIASGKIIYAPNSIRALTDNPAQDPTKWLIQNDYGLVSVLTSSVTSTEVTSISVNTTNGYPSSGKIFIGTEAITYASITGTSFNTLTRAINGTTATVHIADDKVYLIGESQVNPNLQTTLTVALTNSATTMTVANTNGFASAGTIYINSEAIVYISKTSTTFTGLTRGQNGTTAAAHSIGSIITTIGAGSGGSSTTAVLNTTLTTGIIASDVSMTVASTNGFAPSGVIYIDNEAIAYSEKTTTTFTGLTRGLYGSTAASHLSATVITSLGLPYPISGPVNGSMIGIVTPWFGSTAPAFALFCDGSAVSRTTYASLFAIMGTSCGSGDGTTTFNLPDLRGRFLRGVDGIASRDPDSAIRTAMNTGGNAGNQVGSVQLDAFASHTHTLAGDASDPAGGGSRWASGNSNNGFKNIQSGTAQATGGTETRPKNAYCNHIIWWNNPGNYGDVFLANNNAFIGNNTYSGTETFNGDVVVATGDASGTFSPLVLDSNNKIKKQPASASITSTAISFLSTPPVSPNVDDTYVVQPTGTGAWAGQNNAITTWDGSDWGFYTPATNDIVSLINGDLYQFNGTAWVVYTQAGGSFLKQTITSSLTLTSWQKEIRVNCTTGNIVVTIPQTLAANVTQEIVVTRIDNNTNYAASIVAYSGQTINGVNTIWLYNQWDSIKLSSNGGLNSSDIIVDSRNSGGTGTANYLVNELSGQTGLVTGTVFNYPLLPLKVEGSNVSMSSIGNILIKGNSGTWDLSSNVNRTGSTASDEFSWGFYNVTTGVYFGQCGSMETANNTSPSVGYGGIAWGTVSPTVDTVYQVRCTKATGTHTLDANGQVGQVASSLRIKQISAPANIINTVDTLSVMGNSAQTTTTPLQGLNFPTKNYGNIPWNGTQATLTAGKTYRLQFIPNGISASSISVECQIYNVTTGTVIGSKGVLNAITGNYTMPLEVIYQPTATCQISVVTVVASTPGTIGDPSRGAYPQFNITQIGTNAVTGLPSSMGTAGQTLAINPIANGYQYTNIGIYAPANTEIDTGMTFILGQPIYRKVIPFTNAPVNIVTVIDSALTYTYCANVLSITGSFKAPGATQNIPINAANPSGIAYAVTSQIFGTGLYVIPGGNQPSTNSGIVIIEYTKS